MYTQVSERLSKKITLRWDILAGQMRFRLAACLIVACLTGQEAQPPLRVSVTLVQVDAVVTDREGRQVTNLTKDDFAVFENGRPRPISHFSYVSAISSEPGARPPAQRTSVASAAGSRVGP